MARTNRQQPQPARRPFNLVFCIVIALVALIIIVGLVALITWLVFRPKKPIYSIETGSFSNFQQADIHLNSTFDFTIQAQNPNRRVSIYYDSIHSSVAHHNQSIAFSTMQPFFQPRRNVTELQTKLVARDVALSPPNANDLRRQNRTGEIELEVHITARIRYKAGIWKSRRRTLKVVCSPVLVHFSPSQLFSPVTCETDL